MGVTWRQAATDTKPTLIIAAAPDLAKAFAPVPRGHLVERVVVSVWRAKDVHHRHRSFATVASTTTIAPHAKPVKNRAHKLEGDD